MESTNEHMYNEINFYLNKCAHLPDKYVAIIRDIKYEV